MPAKGCCTFFLPFFAFVTKVCYFSLLQVLDLVADVPRRHGPGYRVEGCRRSAELVLGLNLEVGGGMAVRVKVRLESGGWGGQRVQPPQGTTKSGRCFPLVQSPRCHNGMHGNVTIY